MFFTQLWCFFNYYLIQNSQQSFVWNTGCSAAALLSNSFTKRTFQASQKRSRCRTSTTAAAVHLRHWDVSERTDEMCVNAAELSVNGFDFFYEVTGRKLGPLWMTRTHASYHFLLSRNMTLYEIVSLIRVLVLHGILTSLALCSGNGIQDGIIVV